MRYFSVYGFLFQDSLKPQYGVCPYCLQVGVGGQGANASLFLAVHMQSSDPIAPPPHTFHYLLHVPRQQLAPPMANE